MPPSEGQSACIYCITKTRHKFRFTQFVDFEVAASLLREHWGKKILKKAVGPVHYYRSASFKNWKERINRTQTDEELALRQVIMSKEVGSGFGRVVVPWTVGSDPGQTERLKQGHLSDHEVAFEQERVKQWVSKIPSMIKGSDSFEGEACASR